MMRAFAGVLCLFVAACVHAPADAPGERLYRAHCASCHGASAKGDGWLAQHLSRPTPGLTRLTRQYGGAFPEEILRHTIDGRREVAMHGPREMPVWGDAFLGEELVRERIGALLEHLRRIQD